MMNNNKILTVSYGTFSCTLEGFEDSFGTMKAIAEYFRDLAADDRYFGAEPPQPDAEMLARIAEKEVSRRVQAREQDGKIVLSALEDRSGAAAPVPAAAVAAAPAVIQEANATAQSRDGAPDTAQPEETAVAAHLKAEVDEIETAPVSVISTQDLSEEEVQQDVASDEISSVTALMQSQVDVAVQSEDEAVQTAILSDLATDEVGEFAEDVFVEDAYEEEENDIVPGQPDADVEAFFAESATHTDAIDEDEDYTAETVRADVAPAQDAPAPDSIAAKLQRIRAVVAQHEEDDIDDDYLEDEHAEADTGAKSSDLVADARADIEDALNVDDEVSARSTLDDTDETDEVSDILSRLQSTEDTTSEYEDGYIEDEMIVEDESEDVFHDQRTEDTVNNLFDEDESTLESDEDIGEAEQAEDSDASETQTVSEEAPEVKPQHRARVIKVKRADLEAAIDKGDLEEYEDEDDVAAASLRALDELAPSKRSTTTLSPEAEADLARELAELEADIQAGDDEVVSDTAAEEKTSAPTVQEAPAKSARSRLPSIDGVGSADVNRLLAETDHQMDEPESATRRDAFAHLRAAVAAKKADSTIEDDDAPKGVVAYREDLAEVVRPRRPVATEARTERPEEMRPAPLKLVAEQRIDVEKTKPAGPVRPRRVAAVADAGSDAAEGDSFADFAADMGATSLPQLLEAAAAYLSFVEGREQFSRPQLMTKVRQAGGDEGFSREEGLRSFGQLLRAGKIEKIKGGRFTVSDDIGFRPDQRAAS